LKQLIRTLKEAWRRATLRRRARLNQQLLDAEHKRDHDRF
jgi:hypothetical protein